HWQCISDDSSLDGILATGEYESFGNSLEFLQKKWDEWPVIANLGDVLSRTHSRCTNCPKSMLHPNPELAVELAVDMDSVFQETLEELRRSSGPGRSGDKEVEKQQRASHLGRRNRSEHSIYPHPDPINLTIAKFQPIQTAHCIDGYPFDHYKNAPTLEANILHSLPTTITLNSYGQQLHSNVWAMFRDYGYRLEPSFYQMFNHNRAVMVKEHILPIPPLHLPLQPVLEEVLHPIQGARVTRPKVVGLQDMLNIYADSIRANPSKRRLSKIDVFLCGRHPSADNHRPTDDSDLLHVDLDKDELSQVKVHISIDIDSVIWVTHHLQFQNTVKLLIGVSYGKAAPISTNNHVYVNILYPRSEGEDYSHESLRVGLHTLPHIPLLQAGSGTGSFNTYIFFPRMRHKSEFGCRTVSIIPSIVQELFINKVILPALKAVKEAAAQAYVDTTWKDIAWRSGNSKAATLKSFPLLIDEVEPFQEEMRAIIRKDNDLDMFGSFFWVTDARGIKLWTMDGGGQSDAEGCPLEALKRTASDMDWEYMMDRTKGELLLDIGISFHPEESQAGVVGLWKLGPLHWSYRTAGYVSPTTHRSCTLFQLGNMQAEMQSYNLAFEVVRCAKGQLKVCDEPIAYRGGKAYQDAVGELLGALQRASGKSFGVREEIRIGGSALVPVLQDLHQLAKDYISARPVLWIPSKLWFSFIQGRIEAIRDAQVELSNSRPSNHGTITAILLHLLRLTVVNPQFVHPFIRTNLRDLRFEEIIATFGMFFLHDLDIHKGRLPEVEEDSREVLKLMGNTSKTSKLPIHSHLDSIGVTSPDFPLGPYPTWDQTASLLQTAPMTFIKEWTPPTSLVATTKAKQLFIAYTQQVWHTLNTSFITSKDAYPEPTTLVEAMKSWTCDRIGHVVLDRSFITIKAGIKVVGEGEGEALFIERCRTFFPMDTNWYPPTTSMWFPLYQNGYIKDLQNWLKENPHLQKTLEDSLINIFKHLQCFPPSNRPSNPNTRGFIWSTSNAHETNFVVNPTFLRLLGLSKPKRQIQKHRRQVHTGRKQIETYLVSSNKKVSMATATKEVQYLRKKAQMAELQSLKKQSQNKKRKNRLTSTTGHVTKRSRYDQYAESSEEEEEGREEEGREEEGEEEEDEEDEERGGGWDE
ncbi:hypothetical protein FRB99_007093, partial [Tulasnella sp. 403]